MTRTFTAVLLLACAASAAAHHSYGDILREQTVSIDGVVERIDFVNPHVRLRMHAADGVRYDVEWGSLTQLMRGGIDGDTISPGERLIVTGSPHRDPAKRLVTLLTEVRRPADGWRWTRAGGSASGGGGTGAF